MKKIICIIMALIMLFALCGCGDYDEGYAKGLEDGLNYENEDRPGEGYSAGYDYGYGAGYKAAKEEAESGESEIVCETAEELISAISEGANIVLSEGTYNLTEALYGGDFPAWSWVGYNEPGIYKDYSIEGSALIVCGINHISISSEDGATIVSEPRWADVIYFYNCDHVSLTGLTIGHTEEGVCSGDVIELEDCYDTSIEDCDLYGCGAYALRATGCG